MKLVNYLFITVCCQLVLFSSLSAATPGIISQEHWPTDKWLASTPEEQGLNSLLFDKVLEVINDEPLPITGILVERNGYIVFEHYLFFYDENSTFSIFSCTKGIMGLLVGIAVDQGLIDSVDTPVSYYFNSSEWANPSSWKDAITIRHLLTMTTGFEYDELLYPYGHEDNDFDIWRTSGDWVQHMLDLPMHCAPGEQFNFSSGVSHLLSAILTNVTGMDTHDFAKQYLFEPIGVYTGYVWASDPQRIRNGGNGLKMTNRDMARIGHLVLNNGTWNGTQVVSSEWISNITQSQLHDCYSYQWWVLPEEEYGKGACRSGGYYDNLKITVLPEHDLVVTITSAYGEGYVAGWNSILIKDYIINSTFPISTETSTESTTTITVTTETATASGILIFTIPLLAIPVLIKKWNK